MIVSHESGTNWIQLGITAVSWIVGLGTAILLQERHHRRHQLGLAQLLLTELDRIRIELGWDDGSLFDLPSRGLRVVTPQIHRWVQDIICQIAPTSTVLIGEFMMLERLLANLEVYLNQRNERQQVVDDFQKTLENSKPQKDALWVAAREQELRKLEAQLEEAEFRVKTGREGVDLYDRLARDHLNKIVPELTGGPLRGLLAKARTRWRRRKRQKKLRRQAADNTKRGQLPGSDT